MSFFNKIFGRGKSKQRTRDEEKQDKTQLNELVTALADEDYSIGNSAADALVRIGNPAVESLIAALQSDNEDTLFRAARALGRIGDARAIEPLIKLHKNAPSSRVRNATGMALGQFGDPHAIPTLVDLLKIQNWIGEVKRMLVEFGPAAVEPIIASLQDISKGNTYTSAIANHITVLGAIGDARAADVLKALTAPEKEDRLQNLALEALSKLNQPIEISQEEISNLKDTLLDNDYNARKTALARARLIARSVDDAEFQRAFQASEKLQMAYDNQREALSGNEPMQACHEAVELEPDFLAAYVCLSYLYCEYAKKPNDALQWAEKAIQIDPENAGAWTALGKANVALRDASEAARAFHKVVTIEPQHPNLEPLARLVAVYRILGMQDCLGEALVRLNEAGVGLDPDHEREWEQMVMAADKEQLRKGILE
jgi:tetratricopeptide (TPR) repeat protein